MYINNFMIHFLEKKIEIHDGAACMCGFTQPASEIKRQVVDEAM